ncbi:hypothetical protein TIFTF001_043242 [Ficus carica]|uniref:Putative plant transposon protein domain-containing protein n=1 Tax=Ficus carica TaxID=3494 RepID=A0AA87ZAP3_FICCA|nr:hypothetical protein TIFTF001_043235 [Ficus carica]GMN21119.1 hypothetical protein TIFTF001_043236 [Ficus carica]GMN21125.1 hypothetical protein TIFTF001_043241 [Ficus carica]GMN21141.1 hypothetical protein TIFTF001_043242 [Ficus carica]
MPRTKKLAHKQSGRRPKDTTTSYRTFQSDEAEDRYNSFTYGRSFCPEKGFMLKNTPTMGHGQRTVYVLGVQVPIDKDTINQFYDLEEVDYLHTEYVTNATEKWLESALANVCVDGIVWIVSTQGALTIPRISLTPQYKVWYHFLKTRLIPSMDIQAVSKDRVLLLDSIISGRPIDVGKIIYQELCACANKKGGSLWFPFLITGLCSKSGVPMFDTEERLSSKGAIATIAIARITHIKLPGGNQEHPPSDDEEQGQASQATTSRNVATSSSRGPKMHAQQQQYWTYAKQRDSALKKSLHKNFTKPIFPFPAFPERVLEPSVAEENSEDAEEDNEDD